MLGNSILAQSKEAIILDNPDTTRGLPVMQALSLRSSVTEWDTSGIHLLDLSDLLWAANGINRPEEGKRTAPSALNAQDIDIYVFLKNGAYIYNAQEHLLESVVEGDYRNLVAGSQEEVARAPVICLLVSDISRFRTGEDSLRLVWAAIDAGTVSQNISLFCSSTGLGTRPRATMDTERLRELLGLKNSQYPILNNPVTYKND
jgi:SagB-type dehydrogenase family enzyme